jgi:hypothetical protein
MTTFPFIPLLSKILIRVFAAESFPPFITQDERASLDWLNARDQESQQLLESYSDENMGAKLDRLHRAMQEDPTPDTIAALEAFTGGAASRDAVTRRKVLFGAKEMRRNIETARAKHLRQTLPPIAAAVFPRVIAAVKAETAIVEENERLLFTEFEIPFQPNAVLLAFKECEQALETQTGATTPAAIYAVIELEAAARAYEWGDKIEPEQPDPRAASGNALGTLA